MTNNTAKILGYIPKDAKFLVLWRDESKGPGRYAAYLCEDPNECEGLCGVRGEIIISLAELDIKFVQEQLIPFLVRPGSIKKRQEGIEDEYMKDKVFRNDFTEPSRTLEDCKLRFDNNHIPFGGFPGLPRTKIKSLLDTSAPYKNDGCSYVGGS